MEPLVLCWYSRSQNQLFFILEPTRGLFSASLEGVTHTIPTHQVRFGLTLSQIPKEVPLEPLELRNHSYRNKEQKHIIQVGKGGPNQSEAAPLER